MCVRPHPYVDTHTHSVACELLPLLSEVLTPNPIVCVFVHALECTSVRVTDRCIRRTDSGNSSSSSLIHPSPFLLSSIHFSFSFSAFLPLRSWFVLNCWREIARNGISGSIADILKALRIPVPASPSQPAMPHGDIPASKPQIFPSFFASLPFSLSLFLRWHFQQLRMFKLHISASLRSLKAFHRF